MPLTDAARIAAHAARPRIVALWRALAPLRSCIRLMQSGAHPDDETSGLLAALAFRDGLSVSYVCATRGDGGQNDLGAETGADLAAIRTAEMEGAAAVLGLRLYWLSAGPDDPIRDFGFSKSGEDTLRRWGREATLARLVAAIRAERPDILCPTFLDVPGQHGHHRAMTWAAHEAVRLAADPGFAAGGAPWQVGKLVLPAWSGAGDAYDDDEPPPAATFAVSGAGADPVTGFTWLQIGEQSRAFHRTQGMGRWIDAGVSRDWPLHLAMAAVPDAGQGLTTGLPATLDAFAASVGADAVASTLSEAEAAGHAAVAAFPDPAAVTTAAVASLRAVRGAIRACPDAAAADLGPRLAQRAAALARVIHCAAGIAARGMLDHDELRRGATAAPTVVASGAGADAELLLPPDWATAGGRAGPRSDAAPREPWPPGFDPESPRLPALRVHAEVGGETVETMQALEVEPLVAPARSALLVPDRALLNRRRALSTALAVEAVDPPASTPGLTAPEGWQVARTVEGFTVSAPASVADGVHRLALTLDGIPVPSVRRLGYAHTGRRLRTVPAEARLLVLDVATGRGRVGYIGGGNDRVGHWLRALGFEVTDLDDANLGAEGFAGCAAIVVGVFAFRMRPRLAAETAALRGWVERGGRLVTLYHRPWDGWDPQTTPPRPIEIGKPSLRWRVTDPAAPVHLPDPSHPMLTTPNAIGPADWQGWVKERGLYFARSWDACYRPLATMADAGEAPLEGGLLAGRIGAGWHAHVALGLHTQMEALVPGAFRLMANLASAP